jgi:hypothetical protein
LPALLPIFTVVTHTEREEYVMNRERRVADKSGLFVRVEESNADVVIVADGRQHKRGFRMREFARDFRVLIIAVGSGIEHDGGRIPAEAVGRECIDLKYSHVRSLA